MVELHGPASRGAVGRLLLGYDDTLNKKRLGASPRGCYPSQVRLYQALFPKRTAEIQALERRVRRMQEQKVIP